MVERIESVPPGQVMLTEPAAGLVAAAAILGKSELARNRGAQASVPGRCHTSVAVEHRHIGQRECLLVGRQQEMSALTTTFGQFVKGKGCVVGVVGQRGAGKSRIVRECAKIAKDLNVQVFSTSGKPQTSEVSFQVATRLLRASIGVAQLGASAARECVRARFPVARGEDLRLLDDLLDIADPEVALPEIDSAARHRQLAALFSVAALSRATPAVYVIEDAQWIDGASDSILADFLAGISQTQSMTLVTYRPEYRGALRRVRGVQTIALGPLGISPSLALTTELLGRHSSVAALASQVARRAAGNPLFIEEIVYYLAERGVLDGRRGAYTCRDGDIEFGLPAAVQAVIAAQSDRQSVRVG
jgi:predicted ATPase